MSSRSHDAQKLSYFFWLPLSSVLFYLHAVVKNWPKVSEYNRESNIHGVEVRLC